MGENYAKDVDRYFCIIAYSNPRFDKRMLLDFQLYDFGEVGLLRR